MNNYYAFGKTLKPFIQAVFLDDINIAYLVAASSWVEIFIAYFIQYNMWYLPYDGITGFSRVFFADTGRVAVVTGTRSKFQIRISSLEHRQRYTHVRTQASTLACMDLLDHACTHARTHVATHSLTVRTYTFALTHAHTLASKQAPTHTQTHTTYLSI